MNSRLVDPMLDHIRTSEQPGKCPKCGGPLNEDVQCMNGCGYWDYIYGSWVWNARARRARADVIHQ